MATLTLSQVRKTYPNGYAAIHGIDVCIADGEFIVIVGPSGCGKSTLMRMVAGLEEISEGEICIGERVVNRLEPSEREIAMVFQNYALYPHMNVFDNMAYGLKIAGTDKYEIVRRVGEVAKMLGLGDLLQRKPKQLSGGQRQRVAMGRAIVRRPQVFLFDEPLSNLDAKLRVQMRLEIQKLHRTLRTTALYVTHDQVEAMTLADRIIVLNGGKVEQIGTPQEIFARPASVFVAAFIGSPPMNLLPVSIDPTGYVKTDSGRRINISAEVPDILRGKKALLGLRPEYLCENPHGLPLVVESVETLGSEQLVHLRFNQEILMMRCAAKDLPERTTIGATLYLWHHPEHRLHWFDIDSGLALPDQNDEVQ